MIFVRIKLLIIRNVKLTKKLYATFQDIHLINYISISAGDHVSATTAKVRKEKMISQIWSKCKAENSEMSSPAKKFKKTLSQNTSKPKAENLEESSPAMKFKNFLSQRLFDWYKLDDKGLWYCETCRSSKLTNAYAKGHQVRAKTTNHVRHAKCKLYFLYFFCIIAETYNLTLKKSILSQIV